jgi:hypothetical protein
MFQSPLRLAAEGNISELVYRSVKRSDDQRIAEILGRFLPEVLDVARPVFAQEIEAQASGRTCLMLMSECASRSAQRA